MKATKPGALPDTVPRKKPDRHSRKYSEKEGQLSGDGVHEWGWPHAHIPILGSSPSFPFFLFLIVSFFYSHKIKNDDVWIRVTDSSLTLRLLSPVLFICPVGVLKLKINKSSWWSGSWQLTTTHRVYLFLISPPTVHNLPRHPPRWRRLSAYSTSYLLLSAHKFLFLRITFLIFLKLS